VLRLRADVLPVQARVSRRATETFPASGGAGLTVDLLPKKAGFRRLFPPNHPARLALEAQPDAVSEEEYATLYGVLVRLAGLRAE